MREVSKPGYRRAADYVAEQFGATGYRVVRQTVAIPAGSSEGVPVPATKADNVLAYPQNFDPSRPHLVAGAHLDTVAVSPGANDNGTGVATILELARLASLESTRLPVVWVALAGEERRFRPDGALFGARHYLNSLSAPERASLRGMFNVDMVGNGPIVLVCSRGTGKRGFLDHTIASARRLKVPVREQVVTRFFSDSGPFEGAGVPVSWLWAGEHPSVHTPQDVLGVIRIADLERFGRVGWEALRTFRG